MIQLHYYPSNASLIPHILLEELGTPYRRLLVERTQGAHKSPEYLKLNPNGLIPVLSDDATGLVLYKRRPRSACTCATPTRSPAWHRRWAARSGPTSTSG